MNNQQFHNTTMCMLTKQENRIKITMQTVRMGNDYCVMITGGDAPHLGSVALAQLGAIAHHPDDKQKAFVSVIPLVGHMEDGLARAVADNIAVNIHANVVVCCGIHVDNITATEIDIVLRLVKELTGELIKGICHV